jgi:hypothetical protein
VARKELGVLRSIPRHKVRLLGIWASGHHCAKNYIVLSDVIHNIVAITKQPSHLPGAV